MQSNTDPSLLSMIPSHVLINEGLFVLVNPRKLSNDVNMYTSLTNQNVFSANVSFNIPADSTAATFSPVVALRRISTHEEQDTVF